MKTSGKNMSLWEHLVLQGQERKDGIGKRVKEKVQKWRKRKVGGGEKEGHRESQTK